MPLSNILPNVGSAALSNTLPRVHFSFWPQGLNLGIQEDFNTLTLQAFPQGGSPGTAVQWLAPFAGLVRPIASGSSDFEVGLINVNGQAETDGGVLLTLFPHEYLRLARFFATILEPVNYNGAPPQSRGMPVRPIPRYFFFSGTPAGNLGGNVNPGDPLGSFTGLRLYDDDGIILDPAAFFGAYYNLLLCHPSLIDIDDEGTLPSLAGSAVAQILQYVNTLPATNLVRLCDHRGQPLDASAVNVVGANVVNAAQGLYTPVGAVRVNPKSGSATYLLGSPQSGVLGAAFNMPGFMPAAAAVTAGGLVGMDNPPVGCPPLGAPRRDFVTVRVIWVEDFLMGTRDPAWTREPTSQTVLESPPVVRRGETLTLLPTGSDVLGAVNTVLNTPQLLGPVQCVAPDLDDTFLLPQAQGPVSRWPFFPNQQPGTGVPAGNGPAAIATNLLTAAPVQIQAAFVSPNSHNVVVRLGNLPPGLHVRVYPRRFRDEPTLFGDAASEERADGQGGVVPASGTLTLVLGDPLRLGSLPDNSALTGCRLLMDIMVLSDMGGNAAPPPLLPPRTPVPALQTVVSRFFGNVGVRIAAGGTLGNPMLVPLAASPLAQRPAGAVPLSMGSSRAEILGLGANPPATLLNWLQSVLTFDPNAPAPVSVALAREAPRWPTMAHRELLVSSGPAAVVAGGRLTPESLNAQVRLGAPGSRGGRDTMSAGVQIGGAGAAVTPLAWDVALQGLRRTSELPSALGGQLGTAAWNQPNGGPPAGGTFAAALLQNIPPCVQPPNFALLREPNTLKDYASQRQSSWASNANSNGANLLATWLVGKLPQKNLTLPGGLSYNYQDLFAQAIQDALKNTVDATTGATGPHKRVCYDELDRQVVTGVYGRRDSEWALRKGFQLARKFIYLETPGLATTHYTDQLLVDESQDLISALEDALQANPQLKLILCIPRIPDFPENASQALEFELKDRKQRISELLQAAPGRVAVFHPMGVPGRPVRLDSTVVVVDDVWALVGSSSLRRRGLYFDSSTDLVLTDTVYENGVCPSITRFRRAVMSDRLGIQPAAVGLPGGVTANPNFARLWDGREAFFVVEELLDAGGLGLIEPLYTLADGTPPSPQDIRQSNPHGDTLADDLNAAGGGSGNMPLLTELLVLSQIIKP